LNGQNKFQGKDRVNAGMDYTGKQALVLGLGESGLAMANWLQRCGAQVRVADTRAAPARLPALQAQCPAAQFVAGPFVDTMVDTMVDTIAENVASNVFPASLLDGIDFVALSPGLMPEGELAQILPAASAVGLPVWGEIELFAQALQHLRQSREYCPKLIAITGTNGKTTVTSLTGKLVARAGLSVQVAGNISPAALDVLAQMLDQDSLPQVWVLELSSFQLFSTFSLQADAATVLNVTQDHLDWHGSMAAYAAAKARIFADSTRRILNRADPTVLAMMGSPELPAITFGADEPQQAGDFGLLNERGMQWLVTAVAQESGETKRRRKGAVELVPVELNRLMPVDALKIRGLHNATNALAALALCRAIGLPLATLLHGVREYQGEPHRVEWLQSIGGVDFYDDSKGTNVGATVAAINGLGGSFNSTNQKLVLILGGDGKGQDFSPLFEPLARHARAACLIGRDGARLREALADSGVPLIDCSTLEQAVAEATQIAQAGDAVLLSPACASLDMFKNYAHRADVFVAAVREWALQAGELA
jgi:UDP-N-acetylmuramoylalanine--D-glutamate ligase